jgi:hypothetical protein
MLATTAGAHLSPPGDYGFGKGRKTQVHIVPIVEYHSLECYPGVGLQPAAFGLYPDAQVSVDLLAPQKPPEGQRLCETFGPPKPIPGRYFHNPGDGAGSRQEKPSGIFIRGWLERMEVGHNGVDPPEAETSHPQGYQGQYQEGLEEQQALRPGELL